MRSLAGTRHLPLSAYIRGFGFGRVHPRFFFCVFCAFLRLFRLGDSVVVFVSSADVALFPRVSMASIGSEVCFVVKSIHSERNHSRSPHPGKNRPPIHDPHLRDQAVNSARAAQRSDRLPPSADTRRK
jgi:hypothetical protein